MTSLRFTALALLLALLGGPALLDPCLFDCHDTAVQGSGVPPCHDVVSHDGMSVTGTSSCDHDHDAMSADAVVDVRVVMSAHALAPAMLPVVQSAPAPLTSIRVCAAALSPPSSIRPSLDLPLRL